MRKALFLSALLCLYLSSLHSQQDFVCGTETGYTNIDTLDIPWYGDNEYLYRILDTHHDYVTNLAERAGFTCTEEILGVLSIPVRFWIWEASSGESGINQGDLQHQMDVLNSAFENNSRSHCILVCVKYDA